MLDSEGTPSLSPWWRHSVILVMIAGFSVLSYLTVRTYTDAPPIPDRVQDAAGRTLFTSDNILRGQEVFLKYGLMEHGTLWGHGAYLGPDYSADTVHEAVEVGRDALAHTQYGRPYGALDAGAADQIADTVRRTLKANRYDPATGKLQFSEIEAAALAESRRHWGDYFSGSTSAPGLPLKYIRDAAELDDLATYFTWAAWAAVANRPGKDYSYTNNWPYDPAAGNTPSGPTYLWSALSLITLLSGIGTILFFFGRFDYLGWHQPSKAGHSHDNRLLAWTWTPSQRATAWYLGVVAVLFLAQTLLGGVIAHYRVEPGGVLRVRSVPRVALYVGANVAPSTCDLLDRHRLGGGRPPAGPDRRRCGTARAAGQASWCSWSPWRSSCSEACSASTWASTAYWARRGSGWATRAPSTWIWGDSGNCCSRWDSCSGSCCCIGHFDP